MISLLVLFSTFLRHPRAYKHEINKENAPYLLIDTIEQITDHNNPSSAKFSQRYLNYFRYDLYNQTGGANKTKCVILDIGGESDTTMDATDFGFLGLVAKDIQARLITIEHRMFGKSHPFQDTSIANLRYLTVEQVLGDLKYFKEEYTRLHQDELDNVSCRWLITGGSYSGLMSALARRQSMEDNTFYAAISSSGVVLATDNFTDFDIQDEISMGQECAAAARESRIQLMRLIENGEYDYVSKLFGMEGLNQQDFYFVVGELFTLALQYNGLSHVCSPLVDANRANRDLVAALAKFSREYFIPRFCTNHDGVLETYDRDHLLKAADRNHDTGARSWLWMTCNELAYWQVSPGRTGLRPTQLNQSYFQDQCKYVFPDTEKPVLPDVNKFNEKYGGLDQTSVTRVIYTTGSQDPWTWACVTTDDQTGDDCWVHTIKGPEVGHCSDLHAPKADDPIDLQRTQKYIRQLVQKWMTQEDSDNKK